jgi:hypothetical protein
VADHSNVMTVEFEGAGTRQARWSKAWGAMAGDHDGATADYTPDGKKERCRSAKHEGRHEVYAVSNSKYDGRTAEGGRDQRNHRLDGRRSNERRCLAAERRISAGSHRGGHTTEDSVSFNLFLVVEIAIFRCTTTSANHCIRPKRRILQKPI